MYRLLFAIAVISLSGLLSLESWPLFGILMAAMWAGAVLHGAAFPAMLKRLGLFLPFVIGIIVGVPMTQEHGWVWTWPLTILCRSLVAFFTGLWLVQVLPFPELLIAFRQLHLPRVLIDALAFMHRYSAILWEELARLKTARQARSSRLGWRRRWSTSAYMIGELVIRAWDRAERTHRAMLARGGQESGATGWSA